MGALMPAGMSVMQKRTPEGGQRGRAVESSGKGAVLDAGTAGLACMLVKWGPAGPKGANGVRVLS
jgi:hypothetical protein